MDSQNPGILPIRFDQQKSHSLVDLEALEMGQLLEYISCIDEGKGGVPPNGYKHI
jgi:hypothetical protein